MGNTEVCISPNFQGSIILSSSTDSHCRLIISGAIMQCSLCDRTGSIIMNETKCKETMCSTR